MGTKNLGPVTAYAYAKEHGYTGTEEQFEALMGALPSAVTNAQEAVTTVTTLGAQATKVSPTSPASATYNHTTNKLEFNIPEGNGITSVALTSTSGAAKTYTITFDDGTTTNFVVTDGEVTQEVLDETVEEITNGYFDNMTVGSAEQLVSSIMEEDTKPYIFRTTGGSLDVGDRKTEELVGGTIAWNQKIKPTTESSSVVNGITYTTDGNGKWTVSGTSTGRSNKNITENYTNYIDKTHKYLMTGAPTSVSSTKNFYAFVLYEGGTYRTAKYLQGNGIISFEDVSYAIDRAAVEIVAAQSAGITVDDTFYPNMIDLTQMFGTTIADYIYGLEQAEAGAGVAWFKKYFPKPYYAYNAGSLQSVNVASGINTGFNQWDEEWERGSFNINTGEKTSSNDYVRTKNPIRVVPNTTYCVKAVSAGRLYYYDANMGFISASDSFNATVPHTFVMPSNCHYVNYRWEGTSYSGGVCINLHWDGERDGEYEPYDAHVYDYDSDLQLRGIPSLDEFGNLQCDGDIYESDGTVTRKYGATVLDGTQTPSGSAPSSNPNGGYNVWFTYTNAGMGDAKLGTVDIPKFSDKFVYVPRKPSGSGDPQNDISVGSFSGNTLNLDGHIVFAFGSEYDTFAKINAWFASHPTTVVYELATPTEESADPFTSPQVINDFGTEEWIDAGVQAETRDVTVPVGHNSAYMVNLKAKLEMAPNSPDGDGEYLVRQKDGENEYVPFTWTGDHPDLSAGSAHQLISTVQENDQSPYLFRTSGGAVDIGDREFINGIVGGTVALNQLAKVASSGSSTQHEVTFTFNGRSIIANGTANGMAFHNIGNVYTNLKNHVVFLSGCPSGGGFGRYYFHDGYSGTVSCDIGNGAIRKVGDSFIPQVVIENGFTANNLEFVPQCIDLTQMFGSTIADYIYSLETATAGAGVAFFKKLFPKPYYAYNAGELLSVSGLQSHDMTGFNQFDKSTAIDGKFVNGDKVEIVDVGRGHSDLIPVFPSTNYYCTGYAGTSYYAVLWLDAEKNIIINYSGASKNAPFLAKSPSNAYYAILNYNIEQKDTVCFNIAWDNSRNGEYEPYVKHSYPLDSSLTLRGIPKLDANNELYYDGDIYEADGTVQRRYGVVDLGTLSWTYDNAGYFQAQFLDDVKHVASSNVIPAICGRLLVSSLVYAGQNTGYIGIYYYESGNKNYIRSKGSGTDSTAFKNSLNGVYLVYELATPTTEEAEPYTTPQIVDDFGTEEFVIDSEIAVPIPVGHDTDYPINLVAKVEMAPNSPEGDGDYIVRQTSGTNEYVVLGSTSVIIDILNRLQALENQE